MNRIAVAVACVLLASVASARDLNRQSYLIGERAAGMGGAFVALTGDATSSYYNPAGLGGLHRKGLSLSASAYQLSLESYPEIVDWDTGDGKITGKMSSSGFATFPSSIAYVLPLDKNTEPSASHHVVSFSVLVPDHDKLAATLDVPGGGFAMDLQGSFLNTDSTYWIGPSYGVQLGGRLRLGVSAFVLAHMTESQGKFGFKVSEDDGLGNVTHSFMTHSLDVSGTALTALVQGGVQLDVTDRFTIGATLRTPTLGRLWSSVRMLQLSSFTVLDDTGTALDGFADRIEVKEGIRLDYRLPLAAGIGVSYRVPDRFTVALDGTLHLAQSAYRRTDGPLTFPTDTSGNPIADETRALDPVEEVKARQVVNANLGVEVVLSKKLVGRLGAFTDFSAVDRAFDAETTHPKLTRFGTSLGVGYQGERSSTSFGIVYVGGTGTAPGLNDIFSVWGAPANTVDVTAHTITAVLSGSADL